MKKCHTDPTDELDSLKRLGKNMPITSLSASLMYRGRCVCINTLRTEGVVGVCYEFEQGTTFLQMTFILKNSLHNGNIIYILFNCKRPIMASLFFVLNFVQYIVFVFTV